ncbi:hypothetical protein BGZ96_001665 [Linnemannia gamsii]|uniref:LysM domain-containing protein n=1 Tax=Linnemannia gamsii TaxID=64522 RepID=A0ABQ7JM15_9FUNG|nr:hypothetical protein BGZ96_001665 [Linnemannia gamsii]
MKFTLSAVVVLALAASQATAVVPKPIATCTHSYVVEPGTPGCSEFAAKFGITFDDLLKWNDKLSPKCDNLDVGEPLCVSITKGDGPLKENPRGAVVPLPGATPQGNLWDPAPYTKGAAQPTGTASVPATAPTTAPGNGTHVTTGTGAPKPTTAAPGAASSSGAPPPAKTDSKASGAASNKASIVLGTAGLILSAVYML